MVQVITEKLHIFREDLYKKGLYWALVHRLYKIPFVKPFVEPITDFFKPNYCLVESLKIYINKRDHAVGQELVMFGSWEPYETEVFKQNIRAGDVVLDIGANIGYYTLIAAKIVGENGKVFAFEPDPSNFSLLQKNVRANGFKNVVLVRKAVSDRRGSIKLFLDEDNLGDHRIYDAGGRRSVLVGVTTIDHYFRKSKYRTRISLIKMDIQGSEVKALNGAKYVFSWNKKMKVFTEFWPEGIQLAGDNPNELVDFLKKRKFRIRTLNEDKKKIKLISIRGLKKSISSNAVALNLLCEP